jgi:hypothetical protein
MKLKANCYLGLASAILLGFVSSSAALPVTGISLGTAAPPGTLGGWTMAPVGADNSPLYSMVTSVGPVSFDQAVMHDQVGNGWASWSHGFAGDVYDTASSLNPTALTLTMGTAVSAIYFYAEPINFANFTLTATAKSGATLTQIVNGDGGASGFGFYASGSDLITSITVTGSDSDGFAVGEFGFSTGTANPNDGSVPDTGSTLVYACLALLGLAGCQYVFRASALAPVVVKV